MPTCGEMIIGLLESYGVEFIFGIPGVHNVELYRSLDKSSIRHVTPRHEQGAGFMADGYARATGKVGVCFTVTGPGLTNILTAMGQAHADSVPMLVISTVNPIEQLGAPVGALHELRSQRNLAAEVSAFSQTVLHPDQLPRALARAMAVFSSGRPRPVYLEIPVDVITAQAGDMPAGARPLPDRPTPSHVSLDKAAALLAQARTPLVVLGGGAVSAADEARHLIEQLDAPTVLTVNGRGLLAPDHPLLAGENLGSVPLRQAFHDSDVVLAVGTELGETEMYPTPAELMPGGRLIRIDIDNEQLSCEPVADVPVLGDAAAALAGLASRLTHHRSAGDGAARAAALRAAGDQALPDSVVPYRRLMGALAAALPDAVFVGDSAQTVYAANQFFRPRQPRSFFNSSTGYGTLGYGLPAAIGAKLGVGAARPVVALMGDGGILFTIGELASAVEAQVPIVVLLWNNDGYGEIRNYMLDKGIAPLGVDLATPDFIIIARGFGCHAARIDSFEQLAAELTQSVGRTTPTVLEIRQDAAFLAG
ncbi:5-guanidino-2-oxopentanoate decarboxylase [Pseudaminobacter sp. NGMCC 1.201702]|uniref:5-guanidino-2-oxopentanoate decarboxylase n=1 Tax=Pseudaminobacter sp. NGMCC 1.201702 TaxID=3391825 RepID=UPI0039EF81BC